MSALIFGGAFIVIYFIISRAKPEIIKHILTLYLKKLDRITNDLNLLKSRSTDNETVQILDSLDEELYAVLIDCKYIAFSIGNFKYGLDKEKVMGIDISFDSGIGVVKEISRNFIVSRRIPFGNKGKKFIVDIFMKWF